MTTRANRETLLRLLGTNISASPSSSSSSSASRSSATFAIARPLFSQPIELYDDCSKHRMGVCVRYRHSTPEPLNRLVELYCRDFFRPVSQLIPEACWNGILDLTRLLVCKVLWKADLVFGRGKERCFPCHQLRSDGLLGLVHLDRLDILSCGRSLSIGLRRENLGLGNKAAIEHPLHPFHVCSSVRCDGHRGNGIRKTLLKVSSPSQRSIMATSLRP
ncbi:hypothetical protein BCR34DRAFT_303611 [Clohesyomyces aquaticus]|uniref:Uncharacterized protein n=1 Tax=Clohesyomyces aquaticus TaxID=1231657 RepID=A0A1Y1ZQ04_9PLEO|nr:hypothetical protein BCR34DRAFT_303611 [Clohesyomyces aquaticus]